LLEDSGISQPFLAASLGTKVPAKDWGLDNWRGTLEKVTSEFPNLGLVLIGSGDEHSRSEKARAVWRGDCVNLCGKASPRISAAIMSRASLFVGHDSGPMHLAAAVGTSCVAIFALRNPPHQWFPMGEGHTIFYPSLPFDKARTNDFAYQRRAIESISQEEVSREITQRLAALVAKEEMSELP
jgi:ADP-heptose:LPS heptosyltransferase